MAIPEEQLDEITIKLRDPYDQLVKMIDYIKSCANVGHSFIVIVDPELKEYTKQFSMDGDGSFYVQEVKKNGKKVKVKDDRLIEGYLKRL